MLYWKNINQDWKEERCNMNVPAIILEMEDYRKNVAYGSKKDKLDISKKEIPVIDLKNHDTIQKRIQESFRWVYETQGYAEFLKFCKKMKQMDFLSQDSFNLAKGELAEIFLTYTIEEWIKKNNLKSKWKVYSHKTITGDCSVTVRERLTDIFMQNSLHCRALYEHIQDLLLGSSGALKTVFFSFAAGDLIDKRTIDKQKLMPAIDEESLPHFLNALETNAASIIWSNDIFSRIDSIKVEYDAEVHAKEVKKRRKKYNE